MAEARRKKEDDELRLAFLKLLKYGSFYQDFKTMNCDLKFVSRKSNVIGHQLADLMAYFPSAVPRASCHFVLV